MSPLQRSKKQLQDRGYTVAIVEHWNPWAKIRQDLFGIFDLLAVGQGKTIGVQVTTLGHFKSHVIKMRASPHLNTVLEAGWSVELHGWRKLRSGWEAKIRTYDATDVSKD